MFKRHWVRSTAFSISISISNVSHSPVSLSNNWTNESYLFEKLLDFWKNLKLVILVSDRAKCKNGDRIISSILFSLIRLSPTQYSSVNHFNLCFRQKRVFDSINCIYYS